MAEELKGIPSLGQLSIDTEKNGSETHDGIVRVYTGVSPEAVMNDLKTEARPYFDYFVFSSPSPDASHPELSRVYVFSTEANNFARSDKLIKARLFQKDSTGAIAEVSAKFLSVDDRAWHTIKKVRAEAAHTGNAPITESERRIEKSFTERLASKLQNTDAGIGDIRRAVAEVSREMNELIMQNLSDPSGSIEEELPWGAMDLAIDVIDDPEKRGEKALSVEVKFALAPTSVEFNGLPEPVRERAIRWLTEEMQKTFASHPLVYPRRFSNVGPLSGSGGNLSSGGQEEQMLLELHRKGSNVSWRYPQNVPQFKNPIGDKVRAWVSGKARDRVSEPSPGAPMPIPAKVFEAFINNLQKWLPESPGIYDAALRKTGDGVLHVEVDQFRHPKIIITDDTVRLLKEAGIDISEEKRTADGDVSNFSLARHNQFVASIAEKFKRAGWEMQTDLKYTHLNDDVKKLLRVNERKLSEIALIWQPGQQGTLIFDPFTFQPFKPLKKPNRFHITGDLDLPGIGGYEAIKKILGNKPLTTAEFRKRLLDIEELYHKAGYLISRETLASSEGVQLSVLMNEDHVSGTINIRVARIGAVRIEGSGITEGNKKSIIGAMELKEGNPIRSDLLERILRSAQRAQFRISEERFIPDFVQRPDGKTDIVIHADPEQHKLGVSLGGNGESFMARGELTFHHKVRGLSEISASPSGGVFANSLNQGAKWTDRLVGNVSVSVQTVPLNDDGIYLSSVIGLGRNPYIYRTGEGQISESGTAYGGNASLNVHIPIGSMGLASPFYFIGGVHGAAIHRDGQHAQSEGGAEVDKTIYSVGEVAGIEYFNVDQITEGDRLKILANFGMDHNLTEGQGDATVRGSIVYVLPLGKNFELEEKASAGVRLPVYGEFPFERSFMPGSIPLVDFGRSIADPYAANFFWYEGVFLMLTKSPHIHVGIGSTVSSGSNGSVTAGGGLVVRIPIIGMSVYFGADIHGRPKFGLGMGRVWEL